MPSKFRRFSKKCQAKDPLKNPNKTFEKFDNIKPTSEIEHLKDAIARAKPYICATDCAPTS